MAIGTEQDTASSCKWIVSCVLDQGFVSVGLQHTHAAEHVTDGQSSR